MENLKKNKIGNGGCNFITANDYKTINGMSNLYCGWGAEDDEYHERVIEKFKIWNKIPTTLGHIWHMPRVNKNPENTKLNYEYLKNRNLFNADLDGLKQTKFNLIKYENKNNVKNVYVNNITVSDDFLYKSELEKHYIISKT